MNMEEFRLSEDSLMFEKMFSNYLDEAYAGYPEYRYRQLKTAMIVVLFFLKEEMLRDNYIGSLVELNEFMDSPEAKGNIMYDVLKDCDYRFIFAMLDIGTVFAYIKPLVEKYKLGVGIADTSNFSKGVNKV